MASGDKALAVIPLSHIFGLVTLVHTCPHLGIASVVFKSMPTFDILLDAIVRLRIGHFFLVPSLVHAFVKHPATTKYDLGFFKSAMIAAAPLDGEMESAFQKIGGPDFLATQVFGMTECGGMITGLPFGVCPRPGFVGTLLSSTEAKIVDENGRPLPPGQRGHLCVRGPQLCLGYLNNAQATQDAFDADGFLLTGDIADMSVDGFFRIVDRAKRMIKNKVKAVLSSELVMMLMIEQGYQVSPAELEAHLMGLELVADAGVIGRPDDRCGEVPVAFVVLSASGSHKASQSAEIVKEAIKISVQEVKVLYSCFSVLQHFSYIMRSTSLRSSGCTLYISCKRFLDCRLAK
jgi:acyl-CoA synthetase (AMP-forming)/AMP-acid ligase II